MDTFNKAVYDILKNENTKIAKKVLEELNEERIFNFINLYNQFYYIEVNRFNPPTNKTREYLEKIIKRKLGLTYYMNAM